MDGCKIHFYLVSVIIVVSSLLCISAEDRSSYGYKEHYAGVKCYQCGYSPPRVVRKEVKIPVKDYNGRVVFKSRIVSESAPGGWDKCRGPFTDRQAQKYGIDVWDCDSTCYTRSEVNGNIFRGCYRGEYGVDPQRQGCHMQAGSLYCFCSGDKCNSGAAEPFPHQKDTNYIEEFHPYR